MEEKTMVNRFTNQLKEIAKLLGTLGVKVTALNHAEPRCTAFSDEPTKGVDADHMKIYELTSNKSLAFSFHYTKPDKPYVMVTIKRGNSMKSAQYHAETFRLKLNQFVTLLNVLNSAKALSVDTVESTFESNFIAGCEYDTDSAVQGAVSRAMDRVAKLDEANSVNIQRRVSLTESVNRKKAEIKSLVDAEVQREGLIELRQQLKAAENRVKSYENKLVAEAGLEASERDLRFVTRSMHDYERSLAEIVNSEAALIPVVGRKRAKEQIEVMIKRSQKKK
jgi:hypothetical protein